MRRAVAHLPLRPDVLASGRTPLGRIAPDHGGDDRSGVVLTLTAEPGKTAAHVVASGVHWAVVFPEEPSELLRHAATAFAFDALRLLR